MVCGEKLVNLPVIVNYGKEALKSDVSVVNKTTEMIIDILLLFNTQLMRSTKHFIKISKTFWDNLCPSVSTLTKRYNTEIISFMPDISSKPPVWY